MTPFNFRCPLCGGDNACGMEAGECWCQAAKFSDELLARVPSEAGGKACICARCVAAAATPASHRTP